GSAAALREPCLGLQRVREDAERLEEGERRALGVRLRDEVLDDETGCLDARHGTGSSSGTWTRFRSSRPARRRVRFSTKSRAISASSSGNRYAPCGVIQSPSTSHS